jgi:hypothetical protein
LFATGCIGYDPKQAPAAGGTTTLIFHPKFSNTSSSLGSLLAGNVNTAYRQSADKGRLVYVLIASEFLAIQRTTNEPLRSPLVAGVSGNGTKQVFGGRRSDQVPQTRVITEANGSFTLPYRWDTELCAGSTIKVLAKWSNGWSTSYERVEIPVKQGRSCPAAGRPAPLETWSGLENYIKTAR